MPYFELAHAYEAITERDLTADPAVPIFLTAREAEILAGALLSWLDFTDEPPLPAPGDFVRVTGPSGHHLIVGSVAVVLDSTDRHTFDGHVRVFGTGTDGYAIAQFVRATDLAPVGRLVGKLCPVCGGEEHDVRRRKDVIS